jgi:hypothetical protein
MKKSMKKRLVFALIMIIGLSALAGCAGNDPAGHSSGNIKTVEDVLQEGIQSEDGTSSTSETDGSSGTTTPADTGEKAEIEEVAEPGEIVKIDATSESEDMPATAAEETLKETSEDEPEEESAETAEEEDIDVDLTALSSTMVYSEVYNMMVKPDDYIGKTVKMTGMYSYYHDDATGNDYHACIIQDATACCAQGIEFTTTDDFKYPDDYPAMGDDVTVIGRFDIYYEGDFCFMTLLDARIVET